MRNGLACRSGGTPRRVAAARLRDYRGRSVTGQFIAKQEPTRI